MVGAATITKQYFEARRGFTLQGMDIDAGDVVDLAEFELPFQRGEQLANAGLGSLVSDVADMTAVRTRVKPRKPRKPRVKETVVLPEPEPPVQPVLEDLPAKADVDSPSVTELGGWTEESLSEKYTIVGRRELCKKFELTVRGVKSEVIGRLLKFQEASDG